MLQSVYDSKTILRGNSCGQYSLLSNKSIFCDPFEKLNIIIPDNYYFFLNIMVMFLGKWF